MHSCPVFFMRCMWALVRLLTLFPKAPGAHILAERSSARNTVKKWLRIGSTHPSPFGPVQLCSVFPLGAGVVHRP